MEAWFDICRLVWHRTGQAVSIIIAHLSLNTRRLVEWSEGGDLRERLERLLALYILYLIFLVVSHWLLMREWMPAPLSLLHSAILGTLGSAVFALPLWAALSLTRKRPSLIFVGNLAAVGSCLSVIVLTMASVTALSTEPARTELPLIRQGLGKSTVAYAHICGPFEDSAELLSLTRGQLERGRTSARDMRTVLSWGNGFQAPPPHDVRRTQEFTQMFVRRAEELELNLAANRRVAEIVRNRAAVGAAFEARYPSVVWSGWVLQIGMGLVGLLGWTHIWKATVWPARGWRGKAGAIGGLIGAAAVMALIAATWWRLSIPTLPTLDAHEDLGETTTVEAFLATMDEISDEIEDDLDAQEAQVQALFAAAKDMCPALNNHGAWPVVHD